MNDKINDGGPAFPTTAGQTVYSSGMRLRDWFAGQAMAGCYAGRAGERLLLDEANLRIDAECFYQIADAMIAARSKGPSK